MSRLLPYKEAAAYIGMSESTLYKLTRRGEIFPESQMPNPRGMGTPILLFSTDDLELVKKQLYPKPDPAVYLIREEAAKLARIKIGMLKDYKDDLHPEYAWHNGKRHVYYRKDELRELRKRLDKENSLRKGTLPRRSLQRRLALQLGRLENTHNLTSCRFSEAEPICSSTTPNPPCGHSWGRLSTENNITKEEGAISKNESTPVLLPQK